MTTNYYAGQTGKFTIHPTDLIPVPTAYLAQYNTARGGGATILEALESLPVPPGNGGHGAGLPDWLEKVDDRIAQWMASHYQAVQVSADLAAAAANLALINAAILAANINGTGKVILACAGSGMFYINGPIVQRSNVILDGQGLRAKLSGASVSSLLTNYDGAQSAQACTVAWSANSLALTITLAAHGFTKADFVALAGLSPVEFNQVYNVADVVDANTFTVILYDYPSASPTGSATVARCTVGAIVRDLTLDSNEADDGTPNSHAHHYFRAARCGLENVRTLNAGKYGQTWEAHFGCWFERGQSVESSDSCKVYGPGRGFRGRGMVYNGPDDGITIQSYETAAYQGHHKGSGGNLCDIDVEIQESHVDIAASGVVAVYLSEGFFQDDITIRAAGTNELMNGVTITQDPGATTARAGRITLNNLSVRPRNNVGHRALSVSAKVRQLVLNSPHFVMASTDQKWFQTETTAEIGELVINQPMARLDGYAPSAVTYILALAHGTVRRLVIRDPHMYAGTRGRLVYLAADVVNDVVVFEGGQFDAADNSSMMLVDVPAAATDGRARKIALDGCTIDHAYCAINISGGNAEVDVRNCTALNVNRGLIRNAGTGTVSVRGGANAMNGAVPILRNESTGKFQVYSPEIPLNVANDATTTAGQIANHNGGTNAGLCVSTGTGWKRIHDGAVPA